MSDFVGANSDELTRKLAYENWERRGRPFGSPEIDWSAAEKALASSRGPSEGEFSLMGLQVEPDEEPYR